MLNCTFKLTRKKKKTLIMNGPSHIFGTEGKHTENA